MIRCERCRGEKKITGMGGMTEKCKACSGKGFIVDKEVKKPKAKG